MWSMRLRMALHRASRFCGADCGDRPGPVPIMSAAAHLIRTFSDIELIWASPRELLNIIQADQTGCHIITATNDLLKKLNLIGRDLGDYSLETVKMFYDDACKSGLCFVDVLALAFAFVFEFFSTRSFHAVFRAPVSTPSSAAARRMWVAPNSFPNRLRSARRHRAAHGRTRLAVPA